MSFQIVHLDERMLIASERPVIKRAERRTFTDAFGLLAEARTIRDAASHGREAARQQGRAEGLAEARAEAGAIVEARLAEMADAIDRDVAARRAEIAAAAFAAARAIVGDLGDEQALGGAVARTLATFEDGQAVTVAVAPAATAALTERLGPRAHVKIVADPALGPTDCRITSGRGQTIASLSVQFDALAERWGVAS